ncbi:hypothetical protein BdWA1_001693 [Babesia duncani]|uniref:Uncharacterized protein n=1 Tax=Babesia duncani TaxID=323732 RepID=A0AAD9PKC6_9APIC|nr:hypothetical protein BdWA1_003621 [Babesia duncani]KAK2196447.1 hypothetical protein BdWA1_001693 [Babesia duncani]
MYINQNRFVKCPCNSAGCLLNALRKLNLCLNGHKCNFKYRRCIACKLKYDLLQYVEKENQTLLKLEDSVESLTSSDCINKEYLATEDSDMEKREGSKKSPDHKALMNRKISTSQSKSQMPWYPIRSETNREATAPKSKRHKSRKLISRHYSTYPSSIIEIKSLDSNLTCGTVSSMGSLSSKNCTMQNTKNSEAQKSRSKTKMVSPKKQPTIKKVREKSKMDEALGVKPGNVLIDSNGYMGYKFKGTLKVERSNEDGTYSVKFDDMFKCIEYIPDEPISDYEEYPCCCCCCCCDTTIGCCSYEGNSTSPIMAFETDNECCTCCE